MSLTEYNKKRDFTQTSEPRGAVDNENLSRFVIQRHRASRLHYDLRLEVNGVLKSWAIPKGPSMNPDDKRLAIQTEDHPVKYLHFEGSIPKGNYGAGHMRIWDTGTFESAGDYETEEALKKGDLKVQFHGDKLKGTFALVRTRRQDGQKHWLLIKKKDEYAVTSSYDAEDFPPQGLIKSLNDTDIIKPMLATAADGIFSKPGWIYELKWDGYRVLASISNDKVNLYSRNGINYNDKFSKLAQDLHNIPHDVILDGEVVILDDQGRPQFQQLQNYDSSSPADLRFYVFDLLYLNGHSTLDLPLLDRKSLLPDILEGLDRTFYCKHVDSMANAFYEKALKDGMEGVIAKKADSVYTPGYRSEKWLKIKGTKSEEVLICGYTDSKGAIFGSLILGIYRDNELQYAGNCGTGFSSSVQQELLQKMQHLGVEKSPFSDTIKLKGRTPNWVRPELICEIKFSEWTENGRMRHPVYKGLRDDKSINDVQNSTKQAPQKSSKSSSNALEINGRTVNVTNLDKLYWPGEGFRKYDLIDYYIQVSEFMLPFLKDRPQNLHRHPNGIEKEGFYQKDNEGLLDSWIETLKIWSASAKRDIQYLLCQDEASLIYMANLGCIEINPWNSRKSTLDHPDYVVIDLDPSKNNTFNQVIEVAQVTREILDSASIEAYCKTSGSSGLHIYIPLGAKYTYEEAREFTRLICYYILERTKGLTSMDRAVRNRKDKIYLDYLQNRRGQTLAAPYCVRPKPGAPVSAPIHWKELKTGLRITDFNIKNMPARILEHPQLFKNVLDEGINMEECLDALNQLEY
ncbi:DNA ligase D [Christiangramia portivictoriae]|uniref:DNA ligase D n=1 Tax=Christiangramia portivictoriae TaxID=326069 RepID=UPI0003FABFEE|nr:DNA ligase D [Christiangramia portivictoriae]